MNEDRSRRSSDGSGAYDGPDRRRGEDRRQVDPEQKQDMGSLLAFADRLQSRYQVEEEEPDVLETWLSFILGEQTYALPVTHVREVLTVGEITSVPGAPFPILGVMNIRGRVLPVVDLRAGLGLGLRNVTSQSRILVVEVLDRSIGMLIDSAHRVVKVVVKNIGEAEVDTLAGKPGFVRGVYPLESGDVILLAPESLGGISAEM